MKTDQDLAWDAPLSMGERIPIRIYADAAEGAVEVAAHIVRLVRHRREQGTIAVLGLATGSTPVLVYKELIRLHREEQVDFSHVHTFNLDEYYGLSSDHKESYHRFMRTQLFDHLNIPPDQIHIPDGTIARSDIPHYCQKYENLIQKLGGIDLQLLGIGRTGHIGFNEPGSGADSRTRLVRLDWLTRRDAARDFLGEENVPLYALTMGVGTIRDARQIALLAWGEGKAAVLARAVELEPSDRLPASLLQGHPGICFHIDPGAAGGLVRFKYPWLSGPVEWTLPLVRKAVLWLSHKVEKAVLKLVDADYSENGMAELLTVYGSAYDLNILVFNITQHTITGWPGGKPGVDDSQRPERAAPQPKRVLLLSPEPLDAVLGMGGTLHRLARQGHEITVAYQTSGSLAVPDADALRVSRILRELKTSGAPDASAVLEKAYEELSRQDARSLDSTVIRQLKGRIRREEARASLSQLDVDVTDALFLDLPFYEKGRYRQFQVTSEDIGRLTELLREIRPHQIYATGYLQDPLSVQGLCFKILLAGLLETRTDPWQKECRIWLYGGVSREWETHDIEMAVPLSPLELANKLQGIYQHQTQRKQTPFTAQADQEAWQVASERNRATARHYDALGLAEYEAIEAFMRYFPFPAE
jgi:glucosamine-6-phosphate deaminase